MTLIIPVFIMNKGCPNRCVFCNEKMLAGNHTDEITQETICNTVTAYLSYNEKTKRDNVQIAFYGGNFTGMDTREQLRLLSYTKPFIAEGLVHSIRVSTRPDAIDKERLQLLKDFQVDTVEIGVQSMVDEVLDMSGRGHTANDTIDAFRLLESMGFAAGIHLMAGMPGDNAERFAYTVKQAIALNPASVRIHPTLVFCNTELAHRYTHEEYAPLSMGEAIDLCKYAVKRFSSAGIPVIRLGLQTTSEMETPGNIIAGPFHPAFASLVYESIFLDMAVDLLKTFPLLEKTVIFMVSPKDTSYLRGQKNTNLHTLQELFPFHAFNIESAPDIIRGTLSLITKCGKREISIKTSELFA